jgi:hypothetical protein
VESELILLLNLPIAHGIELVLLGQNKAQAKERKLVNRRSRLISPDLFVAFIGEMLWVYFRTLTARRVTLESDPSTCLSELADIVRMQLFSREGGVSFGLPPAD